MGNVPVVNAKGKKVGEQELPADVFEARVSVPLMHQVVLAGLASLRRGTHSTKTRSEVSGGGKKPWRQKGTGRARHGSSRSPIWTGGGVSHGPKPRDHDMRVNKKMKRSALRSALTDALVSGKLCVVSDLGFDEPKTKQAVEILETLELFGRVLVVLPSPTEGAVEKSFRNLPNVRIAYTPSLGVYEVIAADRILFTKDALAVFSGADATTASADAATASRSKRATGAAAVASADDEGASVGQRDDESGGDA